MFGRNFISGFYFYVAVIADMFVFDYCRWTVPCPIYQKFLISHYYMYISPSLLFKALVVSKSAHEERRMMKKHGRRPTLTHKFWSLGGREVTGEPKRRSNCLKNFRLTYRLVRPSFYNVDVPGSVFVCEIKRNFINWHKICVKPFL